MSRLDMTAVETAPAPGGTATALAALLSADAVRQRCGIVHRWVADGRSPHFTLDESKLPQVADYVAGVTRAAYPGLAIPPHSRWRHFSAGGIDRWQRIESRLGDVSAPERARIAIDLTTVSVLLDAGAGDRWRYREAGSGQELARSEGLAVASIDLFAAGAFSSDPGRPLQADAAALSRIDSDDIARGFQAGTDNPLAGLDGRAALLRRLADALQARPDLFGASGRPGAIVDHLARLARGGRIAAPAVLGTLIEAFAPIWPSGLMIGGVNIGDAGLHPAVRTGDATDRVVPFHKLPQWLTYSLIEPLAMADLTMSDLDGLTALPEYRNGGLLIDLGVIRPGAPIETPQAPSSELVVEWRALTVALMDRLLHLMRQRTGNAALTLPQMLEGGTWSAGRQIARTLRPPDGPPPIPLDLSGTVF